MYRLFIADDNELARQALKRSVQWAELNCEFCGEASNGTEVNQESTTLENYQDVLKLKFSTGDVPDVLFGGPKTYSVFVESGNVEDVVCCEL